MAFHQEHELHRRRFGRNIGLFGVLAGFVVLIFGLTIVKIENGASMEAFDHEVRTTLLPEASE